MHLFCARVNAKQKQLLMQLYNESQNDKNKAIFWLRSAASCGCVGLINQLHHLTHTLSVPFFEILTAMAKHEA